MTTFPVRRNTAIEAFATLGRYAAEAFPFDEQRTLIKQMAPVRMGKTLGKVARREQPRAILKEPERRTKGRRGAAQRVADRANWHAARR